MITNIFDFLELRGTDASGVWATEIGEEGRVVYHKEPIKSSLFIKTQFWNDLRKIKTDMMLVHARATSRGGGSADNNTNNHPFVSQDKRIGMVHNGTIDEVDYLKDKYQMLSETDSECLLRIFEHGMDQEKVQVNGVPDEISQRLSGIRDIWSYINQGAMAVAIGERIDSESRGLFLFRNDKRPIWLADLRQVLGQVFFFSSPDIWYNALSSSESLKDICWGSQKLAELPPNQVWFFGIDKEDNIVTEENLYKFKLEIKHSGREFEKGELKRLKQPQSKIGLITKLNDLDEIMDSHSIKRKREPVPVVNDEPWPIDEDDDFQFEFNEENYSETSEWYDPLVQSADHQRLCQKIARTADLIHNEANTLCMERSISTIDYEQLIESLEQTSRDLEGTLQILRG